MISKGKISGEEGWISLGPWGGKDGEYWDFKVDGPMMQITVRYGDVIDSIFFESKSSVGLVIGSSKKIGGPGGHMIETFCIESSVEQLSSIDLTYGEYHGQVTIISLCFNTNRTKYGPIGSSWGHSFESIPIEGGVIAGFHGLVGNFITAIGIFVTPNSIQDLDSAPTQGKISGEEGWLSLGPWGGGDGEYWAFKVEEPIIQITIRYGDVIDSILFENKRSDGLVIGRSKKIGGPGGHMTKTFCIRSSVEQLLSIDLMYGNYSGQVTIISLCFNTNLTKHGPIGSSWGQSSETIPIEGGFIAGFHGLVGNFITAIGIFVTPKVNRFSSSEEKVQCSQSIQGPDSAPTLLEGWISGEEEWKCLGPWGGRDGEYWAYKVNGPIMMITVSHGTVIYSISFESKSSNGLVIGSSKKIGDPGGHIADTFHIDSSVEQLSSIDLTYGYQFGQVTIISLCFNTNLTKYGPFGSTSHAAFKSIPIEGGVVGFHGLVGNFITAIGIFVTPKVNWLSSSEEKVHKLLSIQDPNSVPTQLKGKISGEEGWLSLGPRGGGDGEYWAFKVEEPIIQITVRYGDVIDSIFFESKSSDGLVIGSSKKIGGPGGHMIETFCIDSSVEQLSSIDLTYGEYHGQVTIISLCFNTNRTKYGPIGSSWGHSFESIPIEGGVIAGFHGLVGNFITAIGIFVTPNSIQDLDSAPTQGKISGEKGWISLGPWGGRDGEYWAYKVDGPIMQITVRHGVVIDSILFESKSSDGLVSSKKIGGPGGHKFVTFCIDSSVEQLSSIHLTHGFYKGQMTIVSIEFNTNLTTHGPIGKRLLGAPLVSIPVEGGVIAGFHGLAGTELTAFGIFVAPKVNSVLSSEEKVHSLYSFEDSDSVPTKLKGKISCEEGWISLGPWGGQDGSYWAYKADGPIMQITVRFGDAINSILIESKSSDGLVIGSSGIIGGSGGHTTETFCIDSSVEQLSSISLTYEDYHQEVTILSLCFCTNLHKYGPIGLRSGASSVSIPLEMEGGVIAGFHGGVGKFITAIGVFLVPKVNSTPNSEKKVDSLHSIQDPDSVPTQLKGKISNEEGWIALGPWGGKDGVDWVYKPDGPIMQISICYGEVINSILFRSRSCDGLVIGSSQEIGNTGGHTTETFCIQSSAEQLSSIRMTYEEDDGKVIIVSLRFNTNLKKYGPFGTTYGSRSLIIPIEGGVIAGFHGRVDTYLTAIGIFLEPKVKSLHSIQDPDYAPTNLKANISGEEGWISLGPWGGNGGVDWAYKPDGPIMQISIRYGKVIESILFESRSWDDIVIGSSEKIGNMGGYATEKFCIKSSEEQLSSIEMTYDDDNGKVTIVSLCFNTNRKKYGPFGSKSGASSVSIPIDGGFIAGFHGRIDTYLTAIGIFVAPKVNSLHSVQGPDFAPTQLKDKISDEEGYISLGPWGGKDGVDWAYKYDGPIMQIYICYGAAIDSLLFRSRSCDGLIIGSFETIGGTGGHTTKTFCIDSSEEQLSSISLTRAHYDGKMTISSLCFYTNLKTYGPFGTISGSSLSIPIEGGVVTGFHGRTDTYLTAIGMFLAPKVSSLHSIQDPDSTPTQLKVSDSGVSSKPKTLENVIQNAASSSATSNKDDDRRGAPSPSSEMIRKDLHLVTEQKKALQFVDSTFQEVKIYMDKQINEARKKLEELEKLGSSESEFVELGEAIEKLKFQIPLTSTNKENHLDGVLSPTSKMIRSDLILLDTAFAKANEAKYQAHEKLKELQTLQSSERDSNELQKAESDQKRKELRKAIAKIKVQKSSHSKIRFANSNLHRNKWPNINSAMDGMLQFFYKEPDVPHTIDDGILEAFSKLPEPLRCCLSCFFKFPPMATINRTPMMYLWIGQGYVSQYLHSEGYDSDVEELADKIFDDLIEKGFIEPIYQNFSLVPDSCRMSLTVRSSLYEEAKLRGFTSNANGALDLDSSATCRDLIQHSSCLINVGEAIINCEPEIFKNMKHIRSLYLGRWQSSATHHIELEDAKLLHGLCKLKSLTFLSLRGISMITELPKFILELVDLRILDLRACSNLEVIPDKIGSLKRLTHLDMSECYFLENMPKSLARLSNLQVLKGFLIGDFNNKKQSCTLHDLSGLQKLRKLNIHISVKDLLRLQDLEHLGRFGGLKKLTISWGRIQARTEDITKAFHFATLPPRLQKLDLQCFPMTSLSNWVMPGKLKELTKLYIRGGQLRDLGEVQKRQGEQWTVEILRFKFLSKLDLYWRELRTLFPKLIYLHQVECPNFMNFQCDERGVWMNKEAIDTHMQLQKYLKTSMISSRAMSGSGPTLAQDHSNICPADEKQLSLGSMQA